MLYVFLDIDGVLNKRSQWVRPYTLDPDCVKNLALALDCNQTRIILTSSWRNGYVGQNNPNNTKQIQELENILSNYGLKIIGKTISCPDKSRMDEVVEYLKLHPSITKYIILDDDESEFSFTCKNNYFVDYTTGITTSDTKKIKQLIKRI